MSVTRRGEQRYVVPYSLCELFLLGALFMFVTAKIELRIVPAVVKLGILVIIVGGGFELEHCLRIGNCFRMLQPTFADGNEIGSGEALRIGGFRPRDQFVDNGGLGEILFAPRSSIPSRDERDVCACKILESGENAFCYRVHLRGESAAVNAWQKQGGIGRERGCVGDEVLQGPYGSRVCRGRRIECDR